MSRRPGIAVLTVAAALLYSLQALLDYQRFLTSTFDLVIFDQGVRGYAHFLLLAGHWSPILALLAPLYWIHDSPATLLVAQAVLFALTIPVLWAYTRRRLGSPAAAYFVRGGYTEVFSDDGYVVLHRPADWRTARALVHPVPAARLHTNVCY